MLALIMLAKLTNNLEINLRFLEKKDDQKVQKWLQDPYVLNLTFVISGPERRAILPFDQKMMDQYIHALLVDKTRKTFAIEVDREHVGNVGLKEINLETKRAELFIEIGEEKYRGLGVGKAAMAILLDHAAYALGLVEICLEVLEFNHVALKLYQQLGFEISHRSGWHYDAEGRYWQVWWMKLPAERWSKTRENLLFPDNLQLNPLI
ncbi:MAG: GNAT family N-acetyltransferase [Myxococcota bacterium]